MNTKNTIQELINQAKNTRHLVYEVAAAFLGEPQEKIVIKVKEDDEK